MKYFRTILKQRANLMNGEDEEFFSTNDLSSVTYTNNFYKAIVALGLCYENGREIDAESKYFTFENLDNHIYEISKKSNDIFSPYNRGADILRKWLIAHENLAPYLISNNTIKMMGRKYKGSLLVPKNSSAIILGLMNLIDYNFNVDNFALNDVNRKFVNQYVKYIFSKCVRENSIHGKPCIIHLIDAHYLKTFKKYPRIAELRIETENLVNRKVICESIRNRNCEIK